MKEEDILHSMDSGRNPFSVPEGYMDAFTDRLMARLPERKQTSRTGHVLSLVRRYAAAAVIAGLSIGVGAYLWTRHSAAADLLTAEASQFANEDYIDAALDYELLDNNAIAYYLTEAY